jgi:prepilin-type N-terminal cleavage/methylation domain-containing protein
MQVRRASHFKEVNHMKISARKKEMGFTLIELMIVVAIIGILAALALPKFASLLEKSREAATKGNQNALRGAISIYYGDNEGVNPGYVFTTELYTFSRYLDRLPPVKATHSGIGAGTTESPSGTDALHVATTALEVFGASETGTGWKYGQASGHIFINSVTTDSKGLPYSTYGY